MKTYRLHSSWHRIALCLISLVYTNNAQWKTVSPKVFEYVQVYCIDTIETTLFVGTNFGLFKSLDQGKQWQLCFEKSSPDSWMQSKQAGDTLIVCEKDIVHLSSDKGNTWVHSNVPLEFGSIIQSVALYSNNVFLLCQKTGGILVSADFGSTWNKANSGLPDILSSGTLGVDPTKLLLSQSTLYRFDTVNRWVDSKLNIPSYLNFLYYIDSFYWGISINRLYCSVDSCKNWTEKGNGSFYGEISSFASNKGHLFCGTSKGIFFSLDSGTTWIKCQSNGLIDTSITALLVHDSLLYAGTRNGLFQCTLRDFVWKRLNLGPEIIPKIQKFACLDNHLFCITDKKILVASYDNGSTWKDATEVLENNKPVTVGLFGDTLLIVTDSSLFESLDSGITWKNLGNIPNDLASSPSNGRNILIEKNDPFLFIANDSRNGGVFVSLDHGKSWERILLKPPMSYATDMKYCSNYLFVSNGFNTGPSLNRLEYKDARWNIGTCDLPSGNAFQIMINKNSIYITAVFTCHIFQSKDKGEKWNPFAVSLPQDTDVSAIHFKDDLFIAAIKGKGIFKSKDEGINWTTCDDGIVKGTVTSFAQNSQYLYCVTDSGLWRRQLAELVNSAAIQKNFLEKNAHVISYSAINNSLQLNTFTSDSKLTIYSASGKVVSTLSSLQIQSCNGLIFLPSLARGVYFCNFVKSNTMISFKFVNYR